MPAIAIKSARLMLIMSLLACRPATSQQTGTLRITAMQCFNGTIEAPPKIRISIFDADSVPQLRALMTNFRRRADTVTMAAGQDSMIMVYNSLLATLPRTPGVYHSTKFLSGPVNVRVPSGRRIIVFAEGDQEDAVTSLDEEEVSVAPGDTGYVIMYYSRSDCPKATPSPS